MKQFYRVQTNRDKLFVSGVTYATRDFYTIDTNALVTVYVVELYECSGRKSEAIKIGDYDLARAVAHKCDGTVLEVGKES